MKPCLALLFCLLCVTVTATPRGITQREIIIEDALAGVQAPASLPARTHSKAPALPMVNTRDWHSVLDMPLEIMLPARSQAGLRFNGITGRAEPFFGNGILSPLAADAVLRAPIWIRSTLTATLIALQAPRQQVFAELILNAPDPWVDEIAFCVASSSPEYLNSPYALPQLFLENAQYIYSVAAQLPYVQIIDTGSAAQGGSYHSTTTYLKKDAQGNLQSITVPPDIYYWYLVHPKLSDEIPAYIDPLIVENNSTHNNNIVPPPVGKFWRQYLYELDMSGYPVLSDTLSACATLFNRDGSSGDAIRAIMWWISQNMSFTSNNERPHQPVRIITKRFGRCGEYADLTAALARTALIPCTSISSISTDHVWNEFWEEDWVSWEPVNWYLNNPLVYENGWGKVFGSVFETRSDGLLTPVTERYSQGLATINIQVVDQDLRPVDGARVVLAIFETTPRFDCEQYTDNDGMVSFPVGENRDYRARAETTFGLYPPNPGTYMQLVASSQDGEVYNYQFIIPAVMPIAAIEALPDPTDPNPDYAFRVTASSIGYYVTGRTLWDDIDVLGLTPYHYRAVNQPADVSWMVTDADNMLFLQLDNWCSAYAWQMPAPEIDAWWDIPAGQDWFGIADNSHRHRNAVLLSGSVSLQSCLTAVDDPLVPAASFRLGNPYPNPANGICTAKLELSQPGYVRASVYNIRGQLIYTFSSQDLPAGIHTITFSGSDRHGNPLSSGIYLLKVHGGGSSQTRKLLINR